MIVCMEGRWFVYLWCFQFEGLLNSYIYIYIYATEIKNNWHYMQCKRKGHVNP
jgi:hypothetical protein